MTKRDQGFTLIELLVVIVIIGILAAIVVPKLVGRSDDARIGAAKSDLAVMRNVLQHYYVDNETFPSTEQGLKALIEKPVSAPEPKNWKGPYLDRDAEPADPWGNRYVYRFPSEKDSSGKTYDLFSTGKDGQAGTEDDVLKP
jgi:general secretion pathway protein G